VQRERAAALARTETRRAEESLKGSASIAPGQTLSAARRGAVVVQAALKWLGTPYSWGGGNENGPSYGIAHGSRIHGFDCSGLALYAWARAGVRLDHWTGTQWTSGPRIPLDSLRRGDLVFFARNPSDAATIHHVGIFVGRGRMVEAPYTGGRVRISSIWRGDLIGAVRPAG
jgi:cell wall-associated NlpC family hydrolase